MLLWGDVLAFLASCISNNKQLRNCEYLLRNKGTELIIELSIVVDVGEPFIKACYNLEGDGQLAAMCYDILSSVKASVQVKHWPNTQAVARRRAEEFSTTPGLQQKLIDYAADCVQPGYDYFENKFWTEFLMLSKQLGCSTQKKLLT